jgi:hypothetical protein
MACSRAAPVAHRLLQADADELVITDSRPTEAVIRTQNLL